MANQVEPPYGIDRKSRKDYYSLKKTLFKVDSGYVLMDPNGRGSYSIDCSSLNRGLYIEEVTIKRIQNVFENAEEVTRILREIVLLGKLKHWNVIAPKDVMLPLHQWNFDDVYLVYELIDFDLGGILKSSEPLPEDECRLL